MSEETELIVTKSPPKPRAEKIYQVKITLDSIRPPIWRRVLIPAQTTLPVLHQIIQTVMGWHNCHLHSFEVGENSYTEHNPDFDTDDWSESEEGVRLARIAPAVGRKFRYDYDFGDGWTHTVLVEKILPAEPGRTYPVCLKGKRACPPEDCGGPYGYPNLLEALADPAHEEHEQMQEWVGEYFDPEAFDLEFINTRLRSQFG
jgi:hypothetical protein